MLWFVLKDSYFPLTHLPSCYRTVCNRIAQYANHIQGCSLSQPTTFKVVVWINQSQTWFQFQKISIKSVYRLLNFTIYASFASLLMQNFPFFHNLAILPFFGNCNFVDSLVIRLRVVQFSLLSNKSNSRCAVVQFCYHSYDYSPNWTTRSPITITIP